MDIFSWKYPNEHSRVLLWAMSLTKESEHLASHHLSVSKETGNVLASWLHTALQDTVLDLSLRMKLR